METPNPQLLAEVGKNFSVGITLNHGGAVPSIERVIFQNPKSHPTLVDALRDEQVGAIDQPEDIAVNLKVDGTHLLKPTDEELKAWTTPGKVAGWINARTARSLEDLIILPISGETGEILDIGTTDPIIAAVERSIIDDETPLGRKLSECRGLHLGSMSLVRGVSNALEIGQLPLSVLIVELGDAASRLMVVENHQLSGVATIPAGIHKIVEGVQQELSLKFVGSAAKLFYDGIYDFSDNAQTVAKEFFDLVEGALEKILAQVVTPPQALLVAGTPPGNRWIESALAERLGITSVDRHVLELAGMEASGSVDLNPGYLGLLETSRVLGEEDHWMLSFAKPLLDTEGSLAIASQIAGGFLPSKKRSAPPMVEVEAPKEPEPEQEEELAAAETEPVGEKAALAEAKKEEKKETPESKKELKAKSAPAATRRSRRSRTAEVAETEERKKGGAGVIVGVLAVLLIGGGAVAAFVYPGFLTQKDATSSLYSITPPATEKPPAETEPETATIERAEPSEPDTASPTRPLVTDTSSQQAVLMEPVETPPDEAEEPDVAVEELPSVRTTPPETTQPRTSAPSTAVGEAESIASTRPTEATADTIAEQPLETAGTDDLLAESEPEPEPEPEPIPVGSLAIVTEPADATISLDGIAMGTSPLEIAELETGLIQVEVSKQGFYSKTVEVEVLPDQLVEPPLISLEPVTGDIEVLSQPTGVDFEVFASGNNSVATGTTPGYVEGLKPGDYRITFRRDGWSEIGTTISVEPDETANAFQMYEEGSIQITSEPPGVSVYRGTELLGTTPFQQLGLPPGKILLSLREEGYEPMTVEVTVSANQQTVENIVLVETNRVVPTNELDVRPRPVVQVSPDFRIPISGREDVLVNCILSREGIPEEIEIIYSTRDDLNDEIIEIVRQWRFEPGMKDGKPVRTPVRIPFRISQ